MVIFRVGTGSYENTQTMPIGEPGHHYECWDLEPDEGGLLGTIVVPGGGGPSEREFHFDRPVALSVLRHWISAVPELAKGIGPSTGLL